MKRPSVKWLAVAAAGCIFASSMGTYTYTALADEFVYTDANVSITSIVDHYIEENGGDVFTADGGCNSTGCSCCRGNSNRRSSNRRDSGDCKGNRRNRRSSFRGNNGGTGNGRANDRSTCTGSI